ncbi:hypothetical protein [Metabacillus arenae]|uniref:Uncharacterized protein n=1 Tax=Metabacillus arenae TaxID=2771434 RepID=A0A926RWI1_9BACI|nr:hypothetical protein [Metabacillus arenae]MBD1379187.1 hypothetical protein [Metabacillus arenae]
MLTTLIGIQTICVGVSAYLAYKTTKKSTKVKLSSNVKGFKYYKAGGF